MKIYNRICPTCNKKIDYNFQSSYLNAIRRNSTCRSCRTIKANKSLKRDVSTVNNPAWKGYKGVGYKWFSKYFERKSSRQHLSGDITIEFCYELLKSQDFKCALSGVSIPWSEDSGMSIDRKDSSMGYYKSNIQIVHKDVNLMKNAFKQDYFIQMCKLISMNND